MELITQRGCEISTLEAFLDLARQSLVQTQWVRTLLLSRRLDERPHTVPSCLPSHSLSTSQERTQASSFSQPDNKLLFYLIGFQRDFVFSVPVLRALECSKESNTKFLQFLYFLPLYGLKTAPEDSFLLGK